jgi:hypothetical protein
MRRPGLRFTKDAPESEAQRSVLMRREVPQLQGQKSISPWAFAGRYMTAAMRFVRVHQRTTIRDSVRDYTNNRIMS